MAHGRTPHRIFRTLAALGCALTVTLPAAAQIPRDQYLKYVPLKYPRIIRQTTATARFHLYGDPAEPGFRDVAPKDGIDDARAAWLLTLSTRFAPLMVQNTAEFPIDFRVFYGRDTFPIHVDRWDIRPSDPALHDSSDIDMARLADHPCTDAAGGDSDDCRLRQLVETFGPKRSPLEPEAIAPAERELFSVLYFDFPGFDEKSWKKAYETPEAVATYAPAARVYVHPFIADAAGADGGDAGFELVLQYWFFFPNNDGPNNHEGDWEHINVIVSPRSGIAAPLDAAAVERLVAGTTPLDGDDPVIVRRVEYYLHHYVTVLNFASPNAYAPRAEWAREIAVQAEGDPARRRLLERVRHRAWQDDAETRINVRPIVWIGGDAIGIHEVLQAPGYRDRDGHASYPFRGYYKRIGVGDVGERVLTEFDSHKYFANPGGDWPKVKDYADQARLALTPDWEDVLDPVMSDPEARREWSWLVLPVRFGFPATKSPGAGIASHADTGNLSIVGPAYNDGWNRVGDGAGYGPYELLQASWATPLGLTDSFFPRMGFLNAPVLYFLFKPPLDLAWRTVALPVRAAVGSREPTFFPANAPARRSVSFEVGADVSQIKEDFLALFFTRDQLFPLLLQVILAGGGGENTTITGHFPWAVSPRYGLVFHLTPHFAAESSFTYFTAPVGFDVTGPDLADAIRARATLHQYEYHGLIRYNLKTGTFQPYVTYGHGLTSYQLKGVNVNGVVLSVPDSPRFRPKKKWYDFGFNETVLGGGLDWSRMRLGRVWFGGKVNYQWIHHDIGFEKLADVENFPSLAAELAGTKFAVWRQQIGMSFTVGF